MQRNPFLYDVTTQYRRQKDLSEGALSQVSDAAFFQVLDDETNSLAVIVKHLAGNMQSRWTEMLTTDGEKPDRYRDAEFVVGERDTRAHLMEKWEAGWDLVFTTLLGLTDGDLDRTIRIRGEAHTVREAILRQLTHYAYHAGQIVLLARHFVGPEWRTLSVPRGESQEYTEAIRRGSDRHR